MATKTELGRYQDYLCKEFARTVLEASAAEEEGVSHLHTREIMAASLMTAAVFISSDPWGRTPKGRKELAKQVAKQFERYLLMAHANGGISKIFAGATMIMRDSDE